MERPQNGPGMSIFQGTEQLHVDIDSQKEVEEEAAADQQRRDAELEKLLTNAFDDLYDDNESTSSIAASEHFNDDGNDSVPIPSTCAMETYMNNRNLADTMSHQLQDMAGGGDNPSVSALHYQHCFRTSSGGVASGDSSLGDANELYRQTSFDSAEQLQVLYSVRVREVQRLADQLEQLKSGFAHEKDQLLRKLAFSEAEKERAQLMYKEAQGLLIEQKDKTCQLEKKVLSLEAAVDSLEKTKTELLLQLEASKTSVDTLHHKLLMLERLGVETNDKQLEMFLHNVQVMHNEQIKKLEDDMDVAVAKLSRKELELERTKQESESRSLQLEARLAEQGDTINQIARSLEESQWRCRQLMASETVMEAGTLRLQLAQEEQHRRALEVQLSSTKRELETLQVGLKHIEDHGLCHDTHAAVQLMDTNKNLQEELHRALLSQKEKREEVMRLTLQLEALHDEKQHHQEECARLHETLREEQKEVVVVGDVRVECEQLQELLTEEAAERRALELALLKEGQRVEALEEEIATLRKKLGEDLHFHEQSVAHALIERDEKHEKEQNVLLAELEKSRKECDGVKELYVSTCKAKDEALAALQQLHLTVEDTQADTQTLTFQLDSERIKTKELEAQNRLFVEKLKQGKDNLQAAEKAVAESALLKAQMEAQGTKLRNLERQYEEMLKQMPSDRDETMCDEEAECMAKAMQSEWITEEIERVKVEALLELKKNLKDEGKDTENATKLKQLKEDYEHLQRQYTAVVQRQEEDAQCFTQQLQESRRELALALTFKEQQLDGQRRSEERRGSELWASTDNEKVYRNLTAAYAEKLHTMKAEYAFKVQEISDRIRDETMQYCIQQMRQSEAKYLAAIEKCKENYEEQISILQDALKISKIQQEKLKQSQGLLTTEKAQQNSTDGCKDLEEKLKLTELKAQQAEKRLETTIAKYSAAKKAVHKYKKYSEAQEKHMEKEWTRMNLGFQLVLGQVQQKLSTLIETEEFAQLKNQMKDVLK